MPDRIPRRDIDETCFICGGTGIYYHATTDTVCYCPEECPYSHRLRAVIEGGALVAVGDEIKRLAEAVTEIAAPRDGSIRCVMVDDKLQMWTKTPGSESVAQKLKLALEAL